METGKDRLANLQSMFSCAKCGFCCYHGGDVILTDADIARIAGEYKAEPGTWRDQFCQESTDYPGHFQFKQVRPCLFLDLASRECMIYDARPSGCRAFPFEYVSNGWADISVLFVCKGAMQALMDYFIGED